MAESDSSSSWTVEEEISENGVQHIYVRVPDSAGLSNSVQLQIRRADDPPFLTSDGWAFETEVFEPNSVISDGPDLLVEIPSSYVDLIDDFEPIEISIEGTELAWSMPWDLEPHVKKGTQIEGKPGGDPQLTILFTSVPSQARVGDTINLVWSSENIDSLFASGAWSGIRQASGSEAVFLSNAGEQEFTLTAKSTNGELTETVVVKVAAEARIGLPKWAKILIWLSILALLASIAGWMIFNHVEDVKQPNPPDPTQGGGDDTTPPNELLPGGNGKPETKTNKSEEKDKFEKLKQLLSEGQYDGALKLLYDLTGNGHTGAALIAAESLAAAKFTPGLFKNRDDNVALQYYRLACNSGAGAKSSLTRWKQQLEEEQRVNPSEGVKEMIEQKIPDLVKSCED